MRTPLLLLIVLIATAPLQAADYSVVVSRSTQEDSAWNEVVQALKEKHKAVVLTWEASPAECLAVLKADHPRYTCFVARPDEVTREFVAAVHRLSRKYDDDPYADTFWGILTGYDAPNALDIARHAEPLTIERTASGTEIALEMCTEGRWYCELVKGKMVQKLPDAEAIEVKVAADTTQALVDSLNEYRAQLFVTSGHATERDWQIGYGYRNGSFVSKAGKLMGKDTKGDFHPVTSVNPKVYLPVGNCLMGHVDGPDAMALAWLNSAGVKQMIGYTVPTWFGYAGWGLLDYFVEQPGRYTLTEAFFANQHALMHRLVTEFPEGVSAEIPPGKMIRGPTRDAAGLLFDRDVVTLYGDPAWAARMAEGPTAWEQELAIEGARYTFTLIPKRGEDTFKLINANGAQRGGRPIVAFLPKRVREPKLIEGAEWNPVITDDFLLIPNPREGDRSIRVIFEAENWE